MSEISEFVTRIRNYAEYHDEREMYVLADELEAIAKPMPKIKPLVWERVHKFAVQAKTAFGEITITEIGPFRCEVAFFDDEIVCQSINSARKKAEAEYERRVRECLE